MVCSFGPDIYLNLFKRHSLRNQHLIERQGEHQPAGLQYRNGIAHISDSLVSADGYCLPAINLIADITGELLLKCRLSPICERV